MSNRNHNGHLLCVCNLLVPTVQPTGPCGGEGDAWSSRLTSTAAPVTSTSSAGVVIDSSSPVPVDSRGVSPELMEWQEPRPSDAGKDGVGGWRDGRVTRYG